MRKHGPLFDGRAAILAQEMTDAIEIAVARKALTAVQDNLHAKIKNPTGYYFSRVKVRPFSNRQRVSDDGVVYGPWLEGTGSRNSPRTSFKGYRSFRLAKQSMRRATMVTADAVTKPYIRRMGGN